MFSIAKNDLLPATAALLEAVANIWDGYIVVDEQCRLTARGGLEADPAIILSEANPVVRQAVLERKAGRFSLHLDAQRIWIDGETIPSGQGAVILFRDVSRSKTRELRSLALADAIPQFIWVRRTDGTLEYANRHWTEYAGVSADDPSRIDWQDFVHPDDRKGVQAKMRSAAGPYEIEYRFRGKDGLYRWHVARVQPLQLPDGHTAWLGTGVDIDDLKRTQSALSDALQSLKNTETFLSMLLDHAPAAIYASDREGRYRLVNRAWEQLSGMPRSKALGLKQADVWNAESASIFDASNAMVFETGESVRLEETAPHRDGTRWYDTVKFPLKDLNGNVEAVAGISFEITKRKFAEAARQQLTRDLNDERARLRTIIDEMPAGIVIARADGKVVLSNRWMKELYGAPLGETDLHDYEHLVFMKEDGTPYRYEEYPVVRALKMGEAVEGEETRVTRQNGKTRVLSVSATPIRDEAGDIAAGVCVITDITERKQTVDRLRESEERFRVLAHGMPQLVWTCKPDGRTDFLNQQWFDYTGENRSEMKDPDHMAPVYPDDVPAARQAWDEAVLARTSYNAEYRIRGRDGQYRWHLARAFPVIDGTGNILQWVGTSTDVEEQKRAEQALRASEQRYRFLADAMPQFVWISRPGGGVEYANDFLLSYMGLTLAQVQAGGWREVMHPDDVPRFNATLESSYETGHDLETEYRMREASSGNYRWFLARSRLLKSANGEEQWLGTAVDIHDRKEAEEQILRLNQDLARRVRDFETLVEVTPAGIGIASDRACDHIRFNRAFSEWIGVGGNGIIAGTATRGVPLPYRVFSKGRELQPPELPLRVAAREGRQVESEVTVVRPDGHKVDIWGFATPLQDEDGVPRGSICVFLDVTERNAIEDALRRANADLQQFAYAASHDLQEPIRTVALYAQLLEKSYAGKFDAEGDLMISTIIQGAQRMHQLIRDLLAYTRAVELDGSEARADGQAALDHAVQNLHVALDQSQAEVTCGPLPVLAMSPTHLTQVLQNLIGNAIKYRGKTAPRIQVSADLNGPECVITVADNGIGIDAEHHQRIFGVFKRLHGHEIPGTGVGLAICSRIITHYGGRIWVESESGRGAKFHFTAKPAF